LVFQGKYCGPTALFLFSQHRHPYTQQRLGSLSQQTQRKRTRNSCIRLVSAFWPARGRRAIVILPRWTRRDVKYEEYVLFTKIIRVLKYYGHKNVALERGQFLAQLQVKYLGRSADGWKGLPFRCKYVGFGMSPFTQLTASNNPTPPPSSCYWIITWISVSFVNARLLVYSILVTKYSKDLSV
jgi:hypothetical protein